VIRVDVGHIVHAEGYWISGVALHELHQTYLIERDKRRALERTIDLLDHLDRVYDTATVASDSGISWAWWVSFGAATFAGGMVTGIYLAR
jgi:hypothetical protein